MRFPPLLRSLAADFDPDSPNLHPFWSDDHISAQMLEAHLDGSHDAASRRPSLRQATLAWLDRTVIAELTGPGRSALDIADLGCGPGLYAAELARLGHRVTGIDISRRSLSWAQARASEAGLAIDYRHQSYLDLADDRRWDLMVMIWCDMGALTRVERAEVLSRIHRALKPGGVLVFDVMGPDFPAFAPEGRTWSWKEGGFWSPRPHLVLEERKTFPGVSARRVAVWEEGEPSLRLYHLRDWFFTDGELEDLCARAGFTGTRVHPGVLDSAPTFEGSVRFVTTGRCSRP